MTHENDTTNEEPVRSVTTAVDRASSVMPLDDSSHIDPQEVRQRLVQKRDAENALGSNSAKPDKTGANKHQRPETPAEHLAGFDESPENTAKDKVREDLPKNIENVKKQNDDKRAAPD